MLCIAGEPSCFNFICNTLCAWSVIGTGDGMADLFDAAPGSFLHGFIATLVVIIVSELGDKTFFIAAIMAMRHPRTTVLSGAMGALGVMHVMSACFGALALKVVPKVRPKIH